MMERENSLITYWRGHGSMWMFYHILFSIIQRKTRSRLKLN